MNIKVKPLVWWTPSATNNYTHGAETIFGTYYVGICGGRHSAHAEFFHEGKRIEQYFGDDRGSLFEAQSDAQAHHEARILSAIDTTSPFDADLAPADDLPPCPFCGGSDLFSREASLGSMDVGIVKCRSCNAYAPYTVWGKAQGMKSEADIRADERAKVLGELTGLEESYDIGLGWSDQAVASKDIDALHTPESRAIAEGAKS